MKSFKLFILISINTSAYSQFDDGFTPYNKDRYRCCYEFQHELLVQAIYAFDYDSTITTEDYPGNLAPHMNYGFGIGYLERIKLDSTRKSIGLGFKTVWYPQSFLKFNAIFEFDLLGLKKKKYTFFILGGCEFLTSFSPDLKKNEWHFLLYGAELNIRHFTLNWGFQTPFRSNKPNTFFDDSYGIVEFTYRIHL